MCKKRKINRLGALYLGLSLLAFGIIIRQFTQLNDSISCFIMGVGMGASLLLIGISIIPEERYQALQKFKKKLITWK